MSTRDTTLADLVIAAALKTCDPVALTGIVNKREREKNMNLGTWNGIRTTTEAYRCSNIPLQK